MKLNAWKLIRNAWKLNLDAKKLNLNVWKLNLDAKKLNLKTKKFKSDAQKLTVLSNFHEKVLPFKDQLTHLEPSDMDDFGKLLDQLRKAMPQTQAEIDQSKTANQNIALLVIELNDLFYELDKYIAPYQYKNLDFYSDYRNSRVVKDLKRKSRVKKTETKAA